MKNLAKANLLVLLFWLMIITGCSENKICTLPDDLDNVSSTADISNIAGYYKISTINLEEEYEGTSYLLLKAEGKKITVSPFPWCTGSSSVKGTYSLGQVDDGVYGEDQVVINATFIMPDKVVESRRTFFLKEKKGEPVILVPTSDSFISREPCWQILDSYIASCKYVLFEKISEEEVPLFPFKGN